MHLWTAFLLGCAGSLHCAAMCGPLMVALAKARPRTVRASTGRVVYHLGRIGAYSLLGLVLGQAGRVMTLAGFQNWLSIGLGIGLLAGLVVASKVSLATPVWRWVALLKGGLGGLLRRDALSAQALMGALNGLLPCGLVYVAGAGATATGHALSGAASMAMFGLGTLPVMLSVHLAGQRFPLPARFSLPNVTRVAVVLMAALLILRGLELGIPFLSPNLSALGQAGVRCH
ncbi:MAG TPA: sulfite exporter TauE/SafE family protein [Verrucomicrobiae bacterium]|nr:sulfite exporter TauE/SafE family protein [Verrucomicrobiae bacterium]